MFGHKLQSPYTLSQSTDLQIRRLDADDADPVALLVLPRRRGGLLRRVPLDRRVHRRRVRLVLGCNSIDIFGMALTRAPNHFPIQHLPKCVLNSCLNLALTQALNSKMSIELHPWISFFTGSLEEMPTIDGEAVCGKRQHEHHATYITSL